MSIIEYLKLRVPLQATAERIEKLHSKAERVRSDEQADFEGRSSSFLSFGI
jgi:hypothetical protein